jgi:hypothetical protein
MPLDWSDFLTRRRIFRSFTMNMLCASFSKRAPQVSLFKPSHLCLLLAPHLPKRRLADYKSSSTRSQRRRKEKSTANTHIHFLVCAYIPPRPKECECIWECKRESEALWRRIFRLCVAAKVLRDNLFDCRKVRRTLLHKRKCRCAKIKFGKVLRGIQKMKFCPTACVVFSSGKFLLIWLGDFIFLSTFSALQFNSLIA